MTDSTQPVLPYLTTPCELFTGRASRDGYGVLHRGRDTRAHRVVYVAAYGPVPPGMVIDHICHQRMCINLDHLRCITVKQNCEDRLGPNPNNVTSGVRGVSWHKGNKRWAARVRHNRKMIFVGYFDDLSLAAEAVRQMRNKVFTHNDFDHHTAA